MPNTATRCPRCDNTWTGLSACHCSVCHRTLSGIRLFDSHRRRDTCVDPATLHVQGEPLRLVEGVWRGPERPADSLPAA